MAARRVGYALSGGIVLGAAHVGVLKVLEAAGIRPACIAGTSIGALVGAVYATGRTAVEVEEVLLEIGDWGDLVSPTWKLANSLVSTSRMREFLSQKIGLSTFDALGIPFCAVACDLNAGEAVTLCEGDLVSAVCASSAMPGLFPPEQVNGRTLVDGGIVDNLPVDALRSLGADYTVAVDLLAADLEPLAEESLWNVLQRTLYLLLRGNHPAGTGPDRPDCVIRPRTGSRSFTDFQQVEELIALGEEAARLALPSLQADLAEIAQTDTDSLPSHVSP